MAPKKKRAAAVQKSTDHGPGPDESNASKSGGFAFSKRCKLEKCLACEDNYPTGHQYSGSISAGDAKSVINGHITSINQSVAELSRILSSNGDDVMSAWTNIKDKKKRDAIVSKALPDGFPATKWNLIFVYISHSQGKISGDRDQHRQSFLLPFIGRAELVDYPSKLLKLLDLRTVYKPSQWAPMDHAATEYGRATGMLSTRFSETMFSTRMHDYGQPVDYDETAFHGREISGFSTAELMLEAQRHLYSFLCSVAKLLLEKAASPGKRQDSGNALWKKSSEGGFRDFALENETLDRRPFYEPTNPYEPPLQFDMREVRSTIRKRQSATEDQLWVLQRDIVSARAVFDHVARGPPYSGLSKNRDWRWTMIAQEVCEPLMTTIGGWDRVDILFELAERRLGSRSRQSLDERDGLFDWVHGYLQADLLAYLPVNANELLLKDVSFMDSFDNTLARSLNDPLRARSAVCQDHIHKQRHNLVSSRYYVDQPLTWAVTAIVLAGDRTRVARSMLNIVCSYLNDLVQDGKLIRENESSRVIEAVLNFSAALHLRTSLDARRPRFPQCSNEKFEQTRDRLWDELQSNIHSGRRYELFYKRTGGDSFERQVRTHAFNRAGPLLKRFLEIKVSPDLRKRSIQWLEKAEQSKLALNAFWREVWLVKFEQAMNGDSRTANKVAQWRDIDLLGEYQRDGFLAAYRSEIQTLKAAEKAKEEEKKRQPKPSLKRLPSSDEWQGFRGEEKTSPKKPKTAPKNPNKRSHAIDEHDKGPIPVPMPGLAPPPAPAPPAPKIEVSAASLRVLARLWPVQSRAYLDEGGTIRWRGFQAAMAEVGFQCFPRGGSIFSFESREMGRINIHGPHGTVVNDGLLASYGRRLKNKWGWGYDTFAERTRGD